MTHTASPVAQDLLCRLLGVTASVVIALSPALPRGGVVQHPLSAAFLLSALSTGILHTAIYHIPPPVYSRACHSLWLQSCGRQWALSMYLSIYRSIDQQRELSAPPVMCALQGHMRKRVIIRMLKGPQLNLDATAGERD